MAFLFESPLAVEPSVRSLVALATSAIFCGGVAVIVYYRLIRTLGSIGASSLGYLKAAFGVLVGCLVLHEPFTTAIVVGLVAVLVGVAAINEQFALPRRFWRTTSGEKA